MGTRPNITPPFTVSSDDPDTQMFDEAKSQDHDVSVTFDDSQASQVRIEVRKEHRSATIKL